jgi:hypothetical protein
MPRLQTGARLRCWNFCLTSMSPTRRPLTKSTCLPIRLLDAAAEDADWREVAGIVLHIDAKKEMERAFKAWETHLAPLDDDERLSISSRERRAARSLDAAALCLLLARIAIGQVHRTS